MTYKQSDKGTGESGNVLFLILIAVALFAALSYAVTQSTRSGSQDSGREQSLISSAQISQYPAGVRTSLVRMIIGGTAADDLYFNTPSDFGGGAAIDDTDGDTTDESRAVFHPSGGGAPYQLASPEVMAGSSQGEWIFTGIYEIDRIGSSVAGNGNGNDIIAFLPRVSRTVCLRINEELGITGGTDGDGDGIPVSGIGAGEEVPDSADIMIEGNTQLSTAEVGVIGTGAGDAFSGQPFGCYDANDGSSSSDATVNPYVYYHVLIER